MRTRTKTNPKEKPKKIKKKVKNRKTIEKSSSRKIPEDVLKETLRKVQDPNDPLWKEDNPMCSKGIHIVGDNDTDPESLQSLKIKFARTCVMRRDWQALAKILTDSMTMRSRLSVIGFSLLVKYVILCLAHMDKHCLEAYLKSLLLPSDSDEMILKCTQYPSIE